MEHQREFVQFRQTDLYRHLAERRKEIENGQIRSLIQFGLQSTDPVVRSLATAIAKDGSVWAYLDTLEKDLKSGEKQEPDDSSDLEFGHYRVPDLAAELIGDYTP